MAKKAPVVPVEPGVPTGVPEPMPDPADVFPLLKEVAEIMREDADALKAKIDPSSVFIASRLKIAEAIDEFLALCAERGHRGVPNG